MSLTNKTLWWLKSVMSWLNKVSYWMISNIVYFISLFWILNIVYVSIPFLFESNNIYIYTILCFIIPISIVVYSNKLDQWTVDKYQYFLLSSKDIQLISISSLIVFFLSLIM